jgi:hypothetical protein
VAHALGVIIQTFLADPFLVRPLRVLFQDLRNDVMIRVLQKDHEIVLQLFLANRAHIAFHRSLSLRGFSDLSVLGE